MEEFLEGLNSANPCAHVLLLDLALSDPSLDKGGWLQEGHLAKKLCHLHFYGFWTSTSSCSG